MTVDGFSASDALPVVRMGARSAYSHLQQAWERPVRHNLRIERAALWHSLITDLYCQQMLHSSEFGGLLDRYSNPVDAYELTAGALAISHTLPFTDSEKEKIRSTPAEMIKVFEFRHDSTAQRAPGLFSEWHGWLWTTEVEGRRAPSNMPSLPASMLAEACLRVSLAATQMESE